MKMKLYIFIDLFVKAKRCNSLRFFVVVFVPYLVLLKKNFLKWPLLLKWAQRTVLTLDQEYCSSKKVNNIRECPQQKLKSTQRSSLNFTCMWPLIFLVSRIIYDLYQASIFIRYLKLIPHWSSPYTSPSWWSAPTEINEINKKV